MYISLYLHTLLHWARTHKMNYKYYRYIHDKNMINILKKAKKKKINAQTGYLGPCKVPIQGKERI